LAADFNIWSSSSLKMVTSGLLHAHPVNVVRFIEIKIKNTIITKLVRFINNIDTSSSKVVLK